MKFIVDTMLGRLAKWLRLLGYDTVYDSALNDDQLFFRAHLENRVLLTRDKQLASRVRNELSCLIQSEKLPDQLQQGMSNFEMNTEEYIFSRCVLCNNEISEIDRNTVKRRVPEYIFETVDKFYYCESCKKIYWPGSHISLARAFLKKNKLRKKDEPQR